MSAHRIAFCLAVLVPAVARADLLDGIGAIGDSYTDEYEFEHYPARNWLELLATERPLDFGAYSTASRGEPRRQGYAFNWARSGATASLGLPSQLEGLVPQINSGDVTLVFLQLGINDYGLRYSELHNGTLAGAELDAFTDGVISRLATAAETITGAGAQLVVGNLLDLGVLPYFVNSTDEGRARVTDAISMVNERIRDEVAFPHNAPVIDIFHITNSEPDIGGVPVRRQGFPAGHPQSVFVDGIHTGAAMQGLAANAFVAAVNQAYGAQIDPLSDQTIWRAAEAASGVDIIDNLGDTDGDFDVDLDDLNAVRNNFGCSRGLCPGDATGDFDVNLDDLNAVRNRFGESTEQTYFDVSDFVLLPPAAAPVPEPAASPSPRRSSLQPSRPIAFPMPFGMHTHERHTPSRHSRRPPLRSPRPRGHLPLGHRRGDPGDGRNRAGAGGAVG